MVFAADLRAELPDKPKLYLRDIPPALRAALWQRLQEALEPLRASGKLGMVHFQFAPWVISDRAAMPTSRRASKR